MRFEEAIVETFAGGTFQLERPSTVGDLRAALRKMDEELGGWGDELEIADFHVHNGRVLVTLSKGIVR